MYRLSDGELAFLLETIDQVYDYLINGEDADECSEDLISVVEIVRDMVSSLNYHDTEAELDLIQEEQDNENA